MNNAGLMVFGTLFMVLNLAIVIGALVIGVYGLILFVKLAKRGIVALDIYIENNKKITTHTDL